MNQQACRNRLIKLLQTHIARIDQSIDYLERIKRAIAENRIDQLQQSLTQPEIPVADIEQLEQQRYQLLSRLGFSQDYSGFKQCIAWCDEADALNNLHQQLIERLDRLQHSIQVNNLLVTRGKDRLRRSIGILTGIGNADDCKTYSSNGKALDNPAQRNIATA